MFLRFSKLLRYSIYSPRPRVSKVKIIKNHCYQNWIYILFSNLRGRNKANFLPSNIQDKYPLTGAFEINNCLLKSLFSYCNMRMIFQVIVFC